MKNGEILNMYETLVHITDDPTQKFNIKVSYIFAKNKEKLRPEAMLIYHARQQILLDYGTKDEDGTIIVQKENIEAVNSKINELMEIDSNIQIDLLCISDLEGYELRVDQVEALMPMLYEPIVTGPPIFEN